MNVFIGQFQDGAVRTIERLVALRRLQIGAQPR
jgi:hypothetical protein